MQNAAKGEPKIVETLTLPPTSARRVSLIVTELAVIEPTDEGLRLRERAPGVAVAHIVACTGARLIAPRDTPEMPLGCC
jgi:acetate CoA/acetoacetate CoA-transferase beta subunit